MDWFGPWICIGLYWIAPPYNITPGARLLSYWLLAKQSFPGQRILATSDFGSDRPFGVCWDRICRPRAENLEPGRRPSTGVWKSRKWLGLAKSIGFESARIAVLTDSKRGGRPSEPRVLDSFTCSLDLATCSGPEGGSNPIRGGPEGGFSI